MTEAMIQEQLGILKTSTSKNQALFKPCFYRLTHQKDRQALNDLLEAQPGMMIHDQIESQLSELIKLNHPSIVFDREELLQKALEHAAMPLEEYGVWVYYPWTNRLIHILDEKEFIEVRTNRNKYKITSEERAILSKQKIGVVGLSVGKTISLAMAMERSFGEIRLADFDELELSNLNRLQTGLHSLGLPKAVIAAREIFEIDPFLNVKCFTDGVTENNIDPFFNEGGKLDIVVDECDSLDIKILLRQKAKKLGIPVVMDMNDRGTLDVERFDLEPDRSLLHGMIDHLDLTKIKDLTNIEKIPYILPMLGEKTISSKLKATMLEMGQTVNTWPQLSSSVVLGGAIAADVCRRISLGEFHDSGRYWVDLEEIIKDQSKEQHTKKATRLPSLRINDTNTLPAELQKLIRSSTSIGHLKNWKIRLEKSELIIQLESVEHSGYQPWLFNDLIGIGHLAENLNRYDRNAGEVSVHASDDGKEIRLDISSCDFSKSIESIPTYHYGISGRPNENALEKVIELFPSLDLKGFPIEINTEDPLFQLLLMAEKAKHLDSEWSSFFMNQYINWDKTNAQGVPVDLFEFGDATKALMDLSNDENVIQLLNKWNGGNIFSKLYEKRFMASKGLFMIVEDQASEINIVNLGKKLNRLLATSRDLGIGIEPIPTLPMIRHNRAYYNGRSGLEEIVTIHDRLFREGEDPVFVGRII